MTTIAVERQSKDLDRVDFRTVRGALVVAAEFLLGAGIENPGLDAEVLLRRALKMDRTELYLKVDEPLQLAEERQFQELLRRRAQREPVAYIIGQKEFWSLDFIVTSAVLIPRPETELLVEIALDCLKTRAAGGTPTIFDLGTGSGAIAVCLAKERPDADIWAGDISLSALEVARANALRHGVSDRIHWLPGDLFVTPGGGKRLFDLIVSNPPYVRTGELAVLAPEIRQWEPLTALDGGLDGMDVYRRIIREAHNRLAPDGQIILEIGADMGPMVAELFDGADCYGPISVFQDCAGRDRAITAMKLTYDTGGGNG
ncbi:MAG: peptide chain release factor N(5)-glutamine methyltransferase [Candidatus Binatia bacterium]